MLNIIRYSQIVGLVAIDSTTADYLGEIQEVWTDDAGNIVYLSCPRGYIPLLQVAGISTQAVSTYGHLVTTPPSGLHRLHRLPVQSSLKQPSGWIEDFLFDWHTGEIAAYILSGDITGGPMKLQRFATEETAPSPPRTVLAPEDIKTITVDAIVLEEGRPDSLHNETEALKDFLSEKSHPVRQLVHELIDRLHDLVSPHDQPEVVRTKIKTVGDEMATSGDHDHDTLKEAIDFLHSQWESLQQQIHRASDRAQNALESTWEHLTGKPS